MWGKEVTEGGPRHESYTVYAIVEHYLVWSLAQIGGIVFCVLRAILKILPNLLNKNPQSKLSHSRDFAALGSVPLATEKLVF